MSSPATSAPAATVACPKCMGSRKFVVYSLYTGRVSFEGKCFNCDATGKVDARKVIHSKAARELTHNKMYTVLYIINEAAARGKTERVEFYMRKMIPALFMIGKPNARKILDALRSGEWRDDNAERREDTHGFADPETGELLRALCVELGREHALQAAA